MRARAAATIALTACLLAAGCSDDPQSASPGKAAEERALEGSPPPLAAVHEQGGELLGGGEDAFKQRLAELKGFPVVVNKWASWCGPCRTELPYFQKQSLERGKKVAFLGVDSNDERGAAERFLDEFPVTYPSYEDPDLRVASVFKAAAAFPATAFYDRKGKLAFVHQGVYQSEQQLADDIERYAR